MTPSSDPLENQTPPNASHQLPPGLAELPAPAADANNDENVSRSRQQDSDGEPQQPKPEGSQYESSYRPEEEQQYTEAAHRVRSADEVAGYNTGQEDPLDSQANDVPPPAYSETYGNITHENDGLGTNATVADDGRVNIRINQKTRRFSQIFAPTLQTQIEHAQAEPTPPTPYIPVELGGAPGQRPPPRLNVVIHVVGSRGDVQPFVALGKVLKERYGHRVRLATHPTFQKFVTENGLEFFSIGGDPSELMAFMVKNPGLMPGFDTLRSGDVGKRRRGIAEIVKGCWRSCIETGDGLGPEAANSVINEWLNGENDMGYEASHKPFVADAIIANPPSFAHVHCAEKLGIPLHMMFTMPWSPTQSFPHPLANIQSSNADATMTNFISYALVDMLTWQGLGDIINKFRKDSLGLDPVSLMWAPGMLARLKVPYTYCWSPALIPKPRDWAHHISISGFYFLNLATDYTPDPALKAFLDAGPAPIYIGFGSIVVDDPNEMTELIFEAVKKTGQRALVSKGWGGFGADEVSIPDGVFMLGNVPHDWLFKHVSCVVHHGGAGTTAAGIAAGRPTVVVPFFGDQPFWGAMVAKAGAGPMPIPNKQLTADNLAEAIQEALKPESLERAQELSQKIAQERGSDSGAMSFHQMLKIDDLRCSLAPNRVAVWRVKRTQIRLSALAATVLAQEGELNFGELKLYRAREYETDDGPWDPITGGASAIIGTMGTMMMGIADMPVETLRMLNIHPDSRNSQTSGVSSAGASSAGDSTTRLGRSARFSRDESKTIVSPTSSSSTLTGVSTHPTLTDASSEMAASPRTSGSDIDRAASSRASFMTEAMRAHAQTERSHSRGRSPCRICRHLSSCHHRSRSHHGSEDSSSSNLNAENAMHAGKGIGRIIGAGLKSPMDFSMNVAKGFHNAPRLYGEEVRKVDKVTDLNSGLKTAAKEFGIGWWEGVAGLVKDPYKGAKKEGPAGFVKGVGKGIAGVPLKTMAGVWAIPGYTFKGIYQELQKLKGASTQNYILAGRMAQGYDDLQTCSASERADILSTWKCLSANVKKKRNPGEEQLEALQAMLKEHREKRMQKRERFKQKWNEHGPCKRKATPTFPLATSDNSSLVELEGSLDQQTLRRIATTGQHPELDRPPSQPDGGPYVTVNELSRTVSTGRHPELGRQADTQAATHFMYGANHANTFPTAQRSQPPNPDSDHDSDHDSELKEAIRLSQETEASPLEASEEEDELIERAIQASIAELQNRPPPPDGDEEDEEAALQRAIRASISEAGAHGANEEEQKQLELVLTRSMTETRMRNRRNSDSEWDNTPEDTDEEEEEMLRQALELSKSQDEAPVEDEKALMKAMEESKAEEAKREKERSEEQIVMEYVMRQSLAEEEHRRRMLQGRADIEQTVGESSAAGAASGSGYGSGSGSGSGAGDGGGSGGGGGE